MLEKMRRRPIRYRPDIEWVYLLRGKTFTSIWRSFCKLAWWNAFLSSLTNLDSVSSVLCEEKIQHVPQVYYIIYPHIQNLIYPLASLIFAYVCMKTHRHRINHAVTPCLKWYDDRRSFGELAIIWMLYRMLYNPGLE